MKKVINEWTKKWNKKKNKIFYINNIYDKQSWKLLISGLFLSPSNRALATPSELLLSTLSLSRSRPSWISLSL